jgi:hypothetical protein
MSAPIPVNDPAELRRLAILADACLALDDLRALGMLEGGPRVDRSRCAFTIAYAQERGITWTSEERTAAAVGLNEQLAGEADEQ